MNYLIGYDITEPKRLQKIYKHLTGYATPIQYSLFLFEGTQNQLKSCLDDILKLLNKNEDDLRIYPIPHHAKQWQLGKSVLPEGIIWTALPFNSLIS